MSSPAQDEQPVVPQASNPTDQHWGMLLFESLSAGAMTIFVGFAVVMIVVGTYVVLVWPLTFWDLANLGRKYGSWASTVIWSVFAGGTLAGYVCFSGVAFRTKRRARIRPRPVPPSKPAATNAAWFVSRVHHKRHEGGLDDPRTPVPAPAQKGVGESGSK